MAVIRTKTPSVFTLTAPTGLISLFLQIRSD